MDALFDPRSAEVRRDPYPHYAALRQRAPVYRPEGAPWFLISRYADVLFVLKRPDLFSSAPWKTQMLAGIGLGQSEAPADGAEDDGRSSRRFAGPFAAAELRAARLLVGEDPPAHAPLRAIVNRAFTPRRVAQLEPWIRRVVADTISRLQARDEFDFVEELAMELPVTVTAELLGVEPDRRADFKRWSDTLIHGATGSGKEADTGALAVSFREFADYFVPVIQRRRIDAGADLISAVVQAGDGSADLSSAEVLVFVFMLLVAGYENTANFLSNLVLAFLDHPEQAERVRTDPSLVAPALEEVLRYDSPSQALVRCTTRDVELAGRGLPAGTLIMPLQGSANRDEKRFDDPDRFDVGRAAQGHLSFGFGIHFCLGASLARLEGRIVLESLLPHLGRLARRDPVLDYVESLVIRGPRRLRLRWRKTPAFAPGIRLHPPGPDE